MHEDLAKLTLDMEKLDKELDELELDIHKTGERIRKSIAKRQGEQPVVNNAQDALIDWIINNEHKLAI